ncbi:MAG: hypothetical protein HQ546_05840 [Planctomycetes bacterium]|nr:hypothetical protein [Planctomycetota bacterium]
MKPGSRNEQTEDFAKVAGYLDGRNEPLSTAEAKLARQVRDDEAGLATLMDVKVPDGVISHVEAQILEGLTRRRARLWRQPAPAAIAAALALTVMLIWLLRGPTASRPNMQLTAEQAIELYLREEPSLLDIELAVMDNQVLIVLTEPTIPDPWDLQLHMEDLGEEIEQFEEPWQLAAPSGEAKENIEL